MKLVLYQPEIAQNTGTLLRLAACMKVGVDIIGPCGFAFSDRQLKRSGMDYLDHVDKTLYDGWDDYKKTTRSRLILLDTKATTPYTAFQFLPGDSLMVGTESQGVPDTIYQQTFHQILIPMHPPLRSLNVAISAAMVLGEALRQTGGFYADSRWP